MFGVQNPFYFQITPPDLVTQVILIAESSRLQQLLATYGIQTQTPHQIEPIQIWSPKELSKAYEYLGVNKKLGLTGRPKRPFGVLSTSKVKLKYDVSITSLRQKIKYKKKQQLNENYSETQLWQTSKI